MPSAFVSQRPEVWFPMRILMLGNSLTSAHELPARLASTASCEVVAHTRGGARLAEQLNPKTALGARTAEALRCQRWDFVVLQEMSVQPARSPERYLASAVELARCARANGATPVIYATWPFCDGSERLRKTGFTFDEMHALLHASFTRAADATGALLADVGTEFYLRHDPALYARDGVHPSDAGVDVAVRVISATLLS